MTAAVQDSPRTAAANARAAARLFVEKTWWRSLLLVIVFAIACTFLGRWQWSRHEQKLALIARVQANYDSAPVPVQQVLGSVTIPLAADQEWRQVTATGSYQPDRTVLIRNRPFNGVYGYEVVVPLRTASGADLLVDRGWIPNGQTGARPDLVPAPPAGTVTVTARLRPGEPPSGHALPPGQAERINLADLSAQVGAPVYQAYGLLADESPAVAVRPQPIPRPDLDQGPHLAYALQWWVFGLGGFGLLGYFAFREAQNRDAIARGIDPAQLRRRRSEPDPEDEEW